MSYMSTTDEDEWEAPQQKPARSGARRPEQKRKSNGSTKLLLGIFALLLAITAVAAVAFFSGALQTIAQQDPPVPRTNPSSSGPSSSGQPTAQAPQGGPQQGQAAGAAPQQAANRPQPVETKRQAYGDWIYRCLQNPENQEVRCSILQELSNSQTKQLVFLWEIAQDGKGGLAGFWRTPNGVLLTRGITLDAGTPKPITIPFQTCGNTLCQAVAGLAPDFIETLTKAEKATATIYTPNNQGVAVNLSVNGLKDALAELQKPAAQ